MKRRAVYGERTAARKHMSSGEAKVKNASGPASCAHSFFAPRDSALVSRWCSYSYCQSQYEKWTEKYLASREKSRGAVSRGQEHRPPASICVMLIASAFAMKQTTGIRIDSAKSVNF